MKKVLITGGSHAEIPLIKVAQKMGMFVITTGNNEEGLGHKKADKYVKGDFSDKEFVYRLAYMENVDAIISGCNDFAYLSTAYACEKLNLPGHDSYETAKIIHHKNEFIKVAKILGICTPNTYSCRSLEECIDTSKKLSFPIVLKPIDLTGGKGVRICNNLNELKNAYEEARLWSKEEIIILEEYIIGSNHGATMLLKEKRVVFFFCDNEQYYINKYLVSGAYFPSDVPECTIIQLIGDIEKIADKLNLVDGLFHIQFIVGKDNIPVLIDPCRRTPGDLYIQFVKYATEVDYALEIVKAEIGEAINEVYKPCYHNVARECVMTDSTGTFSEIYIDAEIKDKIVDSLLWAKKGEPIKDILKYKAGIVFLEYPSFEQLYKEIRKFHFLVTIRKE